MNIVAISKGSFPNGGAAVGRTRNYLQGMAENGAEINVICIKPTDNISSNKKGVGKVGKINYQYSCLSNKRSSNNIINLISTYYGIFNAIRIIRKKKKEGGVGIAFIGIMNFFYSFIFYLTCKLYNIKIIHERSEYPFLNPKPSIIFKINLFIYLKLTCRLFDGLVIITDALHEYFSKYVRPSAKLYKLPILIDPTPFDNVQPNEEEKEDFITYCGSMQGDKDGLPILLDAFKLVLEKHDVKLKLIGNTKFEGFEKLKQKTIELGISDKVVFTGLLPHNQMPQLLKNAKITVLSRPNNIQAKGGFPTKLGEYLAAGKPVLVTNVGEIGQYIIDKENGFIAKPDDINSFAFRIMEILESYENSLEIATKGKQLVYNEFNYKKQSDLLYKFLEEL